MGRLCSQCGYERRPDDLSPEYECPRCGVVYAKTGQTPEKRLSPQIKNIQTNDGNGLFAKAFGLTASTVGAAGCMRIPLFRERQPRGRSLLLYAF